MIFIPVTCFLIKFTNFILHRMIYDRHTNLKRIEKSMSNGRKIFRFLKFVEDLKKFYSYLLDSSFDAITILKVFTTLSACFYHFLDNLVWASNVGMINRIISGDLGWKTSKNFFSLTKTLIKLVTSLINFKHCYYNSWMNEENEIKNENYEKILNKTFKNRSKLRKISIDIIHALLKLVTLFYSLKFGPVYSILHPIIVSLCGILYCVISLFKIYYKTSTENKKLLKNIKGSLENTNANTNNNLIQYKSTNNLIGLSQNYHHRSSFELSLMDRAPNCRLFHENYFENYYIDFNKDFPIVPEMVLKANGGDYLRNS